MGRELGRIARELFEGLMAPLVLGGPLVVKHAIGARAALALPGATVTLDPALATRVRLARLRRARRLAPVDEVPDPSAAEWGLSAALHDVLQSTNPAFDVPLRRKTAGRILELAAAAIERVGAAATVGEALARHTWFARVLDVKRTDTEVSWWLGAQTFLGVEPPARLNAWPGLRRVEVSRTRRGLLDLTPLAVERDELARVVRAFLALTPLTDLATCTRPSPPFVWTPSTLALVRTRGGRTLVHRALGRLTAAEVDAALDRATRTLLGSAPTDFAEPAVGLLAEREAGKAVGYVRSPPPSRGPE